MKSILTTIFVLILLQVFAQQNLITGITVVLPTNPDPDVSNWTTGNSMLTISASTRPDANGSISGTAMESRILMTIKKNDSRVCGTYTAANAPFSGFQGATKVWSGPNAVSLLGEDCKLKPGDYQLCVSFYDPGGKPLSEEKCKEFTIKGTDEISYQAPQLLSPADGTEIDETDSKMPLTLRWTPVIPKPKGDITYTLVIAERKQGDVDTRLQTGNNILFEKQVINQTQLAGVQLSQIPVAEGSKYLWYVRATDREGKAYGGNNGLSGVNLFEVKSAAITITYFIITCSTSPNKYNFELRVKNSGNQSLKITTINLSPNASLLAITPALGNVITTGNIRIFTGTFSYAGSYPNSIIAKVTGQQVGNTNLTSMDTENAPIESCFCVDCENLTWNFNLSSQKVANNKYSLSGTINANKANGVNLPIYGAEFQVQSFSYTAQPSSCTNGVTSLTESGMILLPGTTINNSTNIQVFNETVSNSLSSNNNATKNVKLISSSLLPNPLPVNLVIGLPGALPGLNPECCTINYRVCVKATIFYDAEHCYSCTFVKCFDFTNQ